MVRYSGSTLDPYILQVIHVKMQAIITYHMISKRWGEIYSDHFEYELPQDKGYEYDPIMFRQYFLNVTEKKGKYAGD